MSFNRNTDILSSTNQLLMPLLCINMLRYILLCISARVVAIFLELMLCFSVCKRKCYFFNKVFFT
jgi:hypothetical protein